MKRFFLLLVLFTGLGFPVMTGLKHHNSSFRPDRGQKCLHDLNDGGRIKKAEQIFKKVDEYLPPENRAKSTHSSAGEDWVKEEQLFYYTILIPFALMWFLLLYYLWDHMRHYILGGFVLGVCFLCYGMILAKIRSWGILDSLALKPGDLFPAGYLSNPILFIIVGYVLIFDNAVAWGIDRIQTLSEKRDMSR